VDSLTSFGTRSLCPSVLVAVVIQVVGEGSSSSGCSGPRTISSSSRYSHSNKLAKELLLSS
jgi:hypothetical protein